ncbi:MAG: phosphopyruvate hydratase [Defluviitaleaceae bacterium]|nr:phosphopyruvate hydratase [Defluviitaleaceae bacterium]
MLKTFIEIAEVRGREILDSQGNPTVEVQVIVSDEDGNHYTAMAAVPTNEITSEHEAQMLRDGGDRYLGLGVEKAVSNINDIIADEICGMNALDQIAIDKAMLALDGTPNKARLGANAILGVSLAVAKAAATALKLPLYQYLGGISAKVLPVPMIGILNGGKHVGNNLNLAEIMILPVGATSFGEALQWGTEVYHHLKKLILDKGLPALVCDNGGFAPDVATPDEAIELVLQAITNAGYEPGEEICLAINAAQANKDAYRTSKEMVDMYEALVKKFPSIISIEDGLSEDDWDGWKLLTKRLGKRIKIVGANLFATNPERLKRGIKTAAANTISIKISQIGTLTEAFDIISLANRNNITTIISHSSGETEDTTIADICVAVSASFIKTGAPARSDNVAKYNQLIRIEEELEDAAQYYEVHANI